jgi:hypothetical protein
MMPPHQKAEAMESDSDADIPESLAAAWGLRERPGKGPKPGLSLERIVAAAISVAGADIAEAVAAAGSSPEWMMSSYSDVLRKLVDPERFPSVSVALGQGVFDQPDSVDGEFSFGLGRVLDGIDVLVRSRAR